MAVSVVGTLVPAAGEGDAAGFAARGEGVGAGAALEQATATMSAHRLRPRSLGVAHRESRVFTSGSKLPVDS
jgi:hypothetical protein